MGPELWASLAAFTAAVAILASGLALLRASRAGKVTAIGARMGAAVALAAAFFLETGAQAGWSPFAVRPVAWGLALAILTIYLLLVWRLRVDAAGPVLDLLVLALVVAGMLASQPSGTLLPGILSAAPFRAQWALFLLGSGASVIAGNAALLLGLHHGSRRRNGGLPRTRWFDLHAILRHATLSALVLLGSGLTVGKWWAWRTGGSVTTGDPRQVWMAIAWLISAMSLVARRMGRGWEGWTAGLALGATVAAVCGLLAAMQVGNFFGN